MLYRCSARLIQPGEHVFCHLRPIWERGQDELCCCCACVQWVMWQKVGKLAGSLLLQLFVSRALWLGAMIVLANTWRRTKIGWRQGLVIWWAGLMRGAISIALVFEYFYDTPTRSTDVEREIIVTASVLVVSLATIGDRLAASVHLDLGHGGQASEVKL